MPDSYEDLLMWNPGPKEELIGSGLLMPQSKIVVFGAPKTYKSLLACQMACCLARGEDWLGFTPIQYQLNGKQRYSHKVLYVQCEIPHRAFRDRIVKMGGMHPPAFDMLHLQTDFQLRLDTQGGLNKLISWIESTRPSVIFIDPFYKILSNLDEATFNRLFDNVDSLIDKYSCSFVFVAHDTKPQNNDKGQVIHKGGAGMRGPRTLEGWFESIIEVRGDISTDDRQLIFETRHAEALIPALWLKLNRQQLWGYSY